MNAQITVQGKTEFDFSKIRINSDYNIIIHCVYDPFNQFETEFAFLHELTANDLVILWHPVEQGHFDPGWMNKLDDIVASAPYKLVYLTGCSHQLNVNEFIPHTFDLRFFPVFDIRSSDIWRHAPSPVILDKSNKFMYINAKHLDHRKYILGTLFNNNLVQDGTVTYQCYGDSAEHRPDFSLPRAFSQAQLFEAELLYKLCDEHIPISIDNSDFSGVFPRRYFINSYVNIVGETQFVNISHWFNTSFVTEKTFNAIANNQMFIVVGQAGSLDLLQHLGYKTFAGIIDETYDTIVHNGDRLEAVSREIVRFLSRPIEDIKNDYVKAQDIILHNRDRLYSQKLETRLQELINTL